MEKLMFIVLGLMLFVIVFGFIPSMLTIGLDFWREFKCELDNKKYWDWSHDECLLKPPLLGAYLLQPNTK